MVYLNPVIAILHNEKDDRWHPILFLESPLPGPPADDKPVRHKSKAHHTEGFADRELALAYCRDMAKKVDEHSTRPSRLEVGQDIPWDGAGIPAMVTIFGLQGA